MIKAFLTIEQIQEVTKLCNEILDDDVQYDYIVKSLYHLNTIVYKIMTHDYTYFNLTSNHSILIDDILEMDSISDEEKEESANELISRNIDKYKTLAKDILAKIESDKKEAQESGYCYKLMNIPEE